MLRDDLSLQCSNCNCDLLSNFMFRGVSASIFLLSESIKIPFVGVVTMVLLKPFWSSYFQTIYSVISSNSSLFGDSGLEMILGGLELLPKSPLTATSYVWATSFSLKPFLNLIDLGVLKGDIYLYLA